MNRNKICSDIAAIAAATCLLCSCGHKETSGEPARPVRSMVVTADSNLSIAAFSGEVKARYETQLAFRVGGKVRSRNVEIGDHVRRGQTLMQLDVSQESLQVNAAKAEVDAARKRVDQLHVDISRTQQLLKKNFASQAELDQQKLALDEAESAQKESSARYDLSQNQRSFTELKAERDGLVSEISAEAGQVVGAGQTVIKIDGDGDREVVVSVPESRVDEMRKTQSMKISIWALPGQAYLGDLRELAPDTENATRTYIARITIKNPDAQLRLGMTASVQTQTSGSNNAIRVPFTAIYDNSGQPTVWLLNKQTGAVTNRKVSIATTQGDWVLVQQGLTAGDTVVTAGVHMLHEGQLVQTLASAASVASTTAKVQP
jgi:multidrug efflux system membrane fusion protein